MKNIFLKIQLILLLLLSPLTSVLADGQPDNNKKESQKSVVQEKVKDTVQIENVDSNETKITSTNKYFDLVLIRKNQSGFTKAVPYELYITPHLDSPKTQIRWFVPSTLTVKNRHKEFLEMKEGQTYKVKADVFAKKGGKYEVAVNVISWQHDTNYLNGINDTISFDKSLVLQPVSTSYTLTNVLKYVLVLVAFILASYLIVILGKKYSKRIKLWLTPPY